MKREETIDYLKWVRPKKPYTLDKKNVQTAIDMAIEALKDQPQWIPCSERLPEHDEIVLVSFKTGIVQICKYFDDGSENPWWSYIDDCCAWNNVVDAWMPLPEPYKEEGDEE